MIIGQLREDEEFVITAVSESTGGIWRIGENPPDAYLTIKSREIAVEISTLVQQVWGGGEGSRSRHSDDAPAQSLANDLNKELSPIIPDGWMVILTLRAPLTKLQKVKANLAKKIISFTTNLTDATTDEVILGNQVRIHLTQDATRKRKKVVGIIFNRFSNPDISLNAQNILHERIQTKAKKCAAIHGSIWLALLNDYLLADEANYRAALREISTSHRFERIIVVERDKVVWVLEDTTISDRSSGQVARP